MTDKPAVPRTGGNRTPTNATTTSSIRPSLSPLRQRPLARASTIADVIGQRPLSQSRRRSSFMTNDSTFSLDRGSIKSSTDDILLPRAGRPGIEQESHESSHLHSLPLLLAVLPGIGGMLFSGSNVVLTDITLLVLASIFLNWSVRLPWDWYHSAQKTVVAGAEDEGDDGYFPSTTSIIEEEPLPIHPEDSKSPKSENAPYVNDSETPRLSPDNKPTPRPAPSASQTSAATELRLHELMALLFCFISPLLGAYILHAIRGQLSRPSEGLVSNYNLSIFILAAELRPMTHLIKLVQARTLHLQRIVATNPHLPASPPSPSLIQDLQSRLDELEAHVAGTSQGEDTNGHAGPLATEPQMDEKQAQAAAKKALQPDLDALTRAIRRYEKRATLLGLQTESRLNELESRLKDALTLAAGAERAASRKGVVGQLGDGVAWLVGLPARLVTGAAGWMLRSVKAVLEELKAKSPKVIWSKSSSGGKDVKRKENGVGKGKEKERRRKE